MTLTERVAITGIFLALFVAFGMWFNQWLEPETWPLKPIEHLSHCEPITDDPSLDPNYEWEQCTTIRIVR